MMCPLVMTVLGPDRPGIVESLAGLVRKAGGNWQTSRLAHLQNQFAGIVELSIPRNEIERFRSALDELEQSSGLRCLISESDPASDNGGAVTLECVGQDRPGIVYAVSDVLHRFGANVESMDSRCEHAPMAGGQLFSAVFKVRLPPEADLNAIEEALAPLGQELMLDVHLDPKA